MSSKAENRELETKNYIISNIISLCKKKGGKVRFLLSLELCYVKDK